jgi:hypothetical protein
MTTNVQSIVSENITGQMDTRCLSLDFADYRRIADEG